MKNFRCPLLLSLVLNHVYGVFSGHNGPPGVDSNDIRVTDYKTVKDRSCVYVITIVGRGVSDTFEETCHMFPLKLAPKISSTNFVIIGDPLVNHVSFFTDIRSTLVVVRDGKCALRVYKAENYITTNKEYELKDEVCQKVKNKIHVERNKEMKGVRNKLGNPFPYTDNGQVSGNSGEGFHYVSIYSDAIPPIYDSNVNTGTVPTTNDITAMSAPSYRISRIKNIINKGPNKQCQMIVTVSGNGVHDTFDIPCLEEPIPSLIIDRVLLFGNPHKHPFSLYSIQPSTLLVVENDKCTKKSYSVKDGQVIRTPKVLSGAECKREKDKINDLMKVYGLHYNNNGGLAVNQNIGGSDEEPSALNGSPQVNGVTNNQRLEIKSTFPDKLQKGPCKMSISVTGNGVSDTFVEPCLEGVVESINQGDVVVFGNPKKNSFSIFSDSPSALVVIRNKICTMSVYKTIHGKITSDKSPMNIQKCSKIKSKMTQVIREHVEKNKPSTTQSKIVSGSSKITSHQRPTFQSYPSKVPQIFPQFPQSPLLPHYPFSQPPQLPHPVFLRPQVPPNPLTSFLPQTHQPQPLISQPLFPKPNPQWSVFDQPIGPSQDQTPLSPTGNRVDQPWYIISSFNTYENGQKCFRNVKVVGRGVSDHFKIPCAEAGYPSSINDNRFLVVGHPDKGQFSLYTDQYGSLTIIRNGKCTRKTYETSADGKTTGNTPEDVSDEECNGIKNKMREKIYNNNSKNGKGWY